MGLIGRISRILNKSRDFSNPHFPCLPNGSNSLLPTALWGSCEDDRKSLSKVKLSDLLMGGKGGRHTSSCYGPASTAGIGSPSRKGLSQRRRMLPLPEPAPARGQPFSFYLASGHRAASLPDSHLCPQAPWRLLPPGAQESPRRGSGGPRFYLPRGPGAARDPRLAPAPGGVSCSLQRLKLKRTRAQSFSIPGSTSLQTQRNRDGDRGM